MNVLFICTGNTCRSPMAAALFNKIAMERDLPVKIESAGLFANDGEPASEEAVIAMKDYGIDLSEHRAKNINVELIEKSDLVLTMTDAHKTILEQCLEDRVNTILGFIGMDGDIPDPYGGDIEVYKKCAETLYKILLKVADKI